MKMIWIDYLIALGADGTEAKHPEVENDNEK